MMRIGLHVRVAGGYAKAVAHARAAGCDALQVFSSNPRSYRPSPIDGPALDAFAEMRRDADIDPCAIHTPYLINLASDDPKIYAGSLRLLRGDLAAAARGGMRLVNTHLGSYGKRDRKEGFAAICRALEEALHDVEPGVFLVLEIRRVREISPAGRSRNSERSSKPWLIRSSVSVWILPMLGRRGTKSIRRPASTDF